jgi:antitoxin component of RelBE/YafQ-DinJ toxin-antitoxin module
MLVFREMPQMRQFVENSMSKTASVAHSEIRFRVDPTERAEGAQLAERLGMDINEAMRVMWKRFLIERGFPFDMRESRTEPGRVSLGNLPIHGVSTARLAEVGAAAARDAASAHVKAGRLPAPRREPSIDR